MTSTTDAVPSSALPTYSDLPLAASANGMLPTSTDPIGILLDVSMILTKPLPAASSEPLRT
ncbi:MAG TPA: hypothetical protein VET27_02045 [Mycobacterium sp.]|nr:hypothetical protein [Mycobacterium sp.]